MRTLYPWIESQLNKPLYPGITFILLWGILLFFYITSLFHSLINPSLVGFLIKGWEEREGTFQRFVSKIEVIGSGSGEIGLVTTMFYHLRILSK